MLHKVRLVCVVCVIAGLLLGCGGSKKSIKEQMLDDMDSDYDLVADITGVDDSTPVDIDNGEEEQPVAPVAQPDDDVAGEAIAGPQGAYVAQIIIEGNPSSGTYNVKDIAAGGEIVKRNVPVGEEIRLNPGMYDMVFTAAKVTGKPTFELNDVEIIKGRRIKRDVKIPVGRIRLVTGGRCVKKPIHIKPKGADDWYSGKFFTCQEMLLIAGEYEAVMGKLGRGGTPISGIQVYDGGKRDVLIRKQ